ncbi:helix-turn-helix domain-containing protein [Alicyclobacillus sendaiensis]|uniref:helix-turn-helix domain-containing protein n=1 Tax=Alicyclobacillus sendaiensis TaxID=192387 RepID=UPI0026F4683A|nr:helix-turn-helix domain-containing protein [Alicyclobacillus sendaiensis]
MAYTPAKVRKGWSENWFRCPNSIYDIDYISGYAKAVYIFLCRCADGEGQSFPGYNAIAKAIGFGRTRTIEAIKELEQAGLLVKEHRRNEETGEYYSNLYTVIHPDDVAFRGGMSPDDIPMSPHDIPVSHGDTPLSPDDIPMSPHDRRVSPGGREVRSIDQDPPTKIYIHTRSQAAATLATSNNEHLTSNTALEEVCETVNEALVQLGIRAQKKTLLHWLQIATPEEIIEAASLATREGVKSPAGYIGTVLRNGLVRVEKSTAKHKDPRYNEFYKLFP